MEKRTIFYIVAIIIVLAVAFLSQQAYTRSMAKNMVSGASNQAQPYLAKGSEWVANNILSKLGGEVAKRGEAIQNNVEQQKNKISENILEKTKNYFAGIANSIVNPGTCTTSQTSASQ